MRKVPLLPSGERVELAGLERVERRGEEATGREARDRERPLLTILTRRSAVSLVNTLANTAG
jgi:hypothetical protein